MDKRICIVCGKEFEPDSYKRKICSPECIIVNRKQQGAKYRSLAKEKTKYEKLTLEEESKRARELGLTYGKYQELKYLGKL